MSDIWKSWRRFKGGNVISANFSGTDKEIEIIRKNVIKSIWNGRLITKDGTQALVLLHYKIRIKCKKYF